MGARSGGEGDSPWLEVSNGRPKAYKLLNFIKSILKLCSCTFQNKVAEIRVEHLGRQF